MTRLLLLFTLVPLAELYLLFQITAWWDSPQYTFALIIITGVVGASLARWQGARTWFRLQQDLAAGRVPADALMDGVMIFVAGALLLTPGILTDVVGFGLLLPPIRALLKIRLRKRFTLPGGGNPAGGNPGVYTWSSGSPPPRDQIIESQLIDDDEEDQSG